MTATSPVLGPLVGVYGLVGDCERLLAVRDSDVAAYRLPGGLVRVGETVENALRRTLREQVHSHVACLDFCAAVEVRAQHADIQPAVFELALLFDVTLTDPGALRAGHGEARWGTDSELSHLDLRPTALANWLRAGGLTGEHPWWPARS
ncbi:NUDIX domain-containing protein [Saccharothrix xinjiangensis]|uniref:NUDIX domain-containing protein n=1 Tax=Saccharothrix xinjiangensis TaxID=204798 RepID=A0ABV9Y178_9PSEU